MFAKILLGIETAVGLILMLCAYYNGKDSAFADALGVELNLRSGLILMGGFYFLKGLIQLVLEMAEPSTITLIKRFLLLFESISGFIMVITSYCDSQQTALEGYFGMDFTVNHGLVFLGVFYISKAFFQMVLERGEATEVADI
jgi:hypothetical protein